MSTLTKAITDYNARAEAAVHAPLAAFHEALAPLTQTLRARMAERDAARAAGAGEPFAQAQRALAALTLTASSPPGLAPAVREARGVCRLVLEEVLNTAAHAALLEQIEGTTLGAVRSFPTLVDEYRRRLTAATVRHVGELEPLRAQLDAALARVRARLGGEIEAPGGSGPEEFPAPATPLAPAASVVERYVTGRRRSRRAEAL